MKRFNHIYQVTCLVLILSSFASNIFANDWVQHASAVYVTKDGDSKFYNTKSEEHGAFDAQSNAINPGDGDWQSILFNGQNFGAHTTQSGTLILRAAEVKTAKWGTGNVCAPYLNWVIYPQGNRPGIPVFTESKVNYYSDCNGVTFPDTYGPCSTGWQKWQTGASGGVGHLGSQVVVDLTNRNEGNYSVEIFYRLRGSLSGGGCDDVIRYDNNLGNNYIATFTICPTMTYASLTHPATCGGNGTITANVTGIPNGTYSDRFFYGPEINGTSFSNVEVNNGVATIPAPAGAYTNIRYWHTTGCSPTTGFAATLTNPSVNSGNTISAAQTICSGSTPTGLSGTVPTLAPVGTPATFSYQWQSRTGANPFADIALATGQNYSPGALTETTDFRRLVKITGCTDHESNTITITVNNTTAGEIGSHQTICNGATPASLTNTMSGTGSGISYRWESSTTDATSGFATIGGQTADTYAPGALTQTTWFRRITISTLNTVVCESVPTAAVQITVQNTPTAGAIAAAQTICNSATPNALTSTTAGTGSGTITYRWESSTTDATSGFATIGGQTAATYAPGALTQTTWFRRITVSTQNTVACEGSPTTAVQITVQNTPTAGAIATAQTICNGATPNALTSTTAGTGSGTITYRWESSTTDATSGFATIGGQTAATYAPGALTQTTWFRRITISTQNTVACESSPTTAVQITVQNTPTAGAIATAQTICNGATPNALTSTTGGTGSGTITYRWEISTTDATSGFATIGGQTADTYAPGALTQTTWFRRITVSTQNTVACEGSPTTAVQITVNPNPSISNIVANCTGGTLDNVTVTATIASGTIEYSSDNGANYQASNVFTGLSIGTNYTFMVRGVGTTCTASDTFNPSCSCPTVTNNTISTSHNVCSGNVPNELTGLVPTIDPVAPFSYQWQSKPVASGSFTNVAIGGTNIDYTPVALTESTEFRRQVIVTGCPNFNSNIVTVTVNNAPSISAIAVPATVCSGSNLSLTTPTVTNNGSAITSQGWQIETAVGSNSFVAFASPFTVSFSDNGKEIRYSATNSCGTITSNEVAVTVNDDPSLSAIAAPAAVCSGSNLSLITPTVTNNGSAITSQGWQIETAVGSNSFVAFASPFTVSFSDNGKEIRYSATNSCGTITSNEEAITVNDDPSLSAIAAPAAVCSGSNLSLTTPTVTNNGSAITSQGWEIETAVGSNSFVAFSSPFTVSFSDNGKEIRYSATNSCGTITSNEVAITVNDDPSLSAIAAPAAVCSGSNLSLTTPTITTNGSAISIQNWELETGVGSGLFAPFASPFTVSYSDNGKLIRYSTTNSCGTTTTNNVAITVHDEPTVPSISTPVAACHNTILLVTTPAVSNNGSGISDENWQIETVVGSGIYTNFNLPFTANFADNGKAIRYYATNSCGTTESNSVTITINNAPSIAVISAPNAVCSGTGLNLSNPTITTNGTAITEENWEIETGIGTNTFVTFNTPYIVDFSDSGKLIRYSAINACGNTKSNEVTITVHDVPSLSAIASPTAVCSGSNLSLTDPSVTPNGTVVTSENWEIETAVGSATFITFAAPFTVNFADNGKLIRYSATNACGTTTSNEVIITVYDIPAIVTTTPNYTCGEGTVLLQATASLGTIHWYEDETIVSSITTGTSFTTPVLSATTTYYVDATENGCTTANRTAIVATVRTIPDITSVTPGERCGAGEVNLSATASAGVINWYEAETGGISQATAPNFTTPSIAINTTYYVDATHDNCTTLSRTAVLATVKEIPTITSVTPGERCGEGVVSLSAIPSVGAVNWYDAETGGTLLSTGNTYLTTSLATTTTFYVDATSNSCTSPTRTAVIATIKTAPSVTSVTPNERCGEGAVALAATANNGTLNWFTTDLGGLSIGAGEDFTTPSIVATTNFYVSATHNGCTSDRTPVLATVKPVPVILSTTPAVRCGNGTVRLSASTNMGTINWFASETEGTNLSSGTNFNTPNLSTNTTYYVESILNGCSSPTRTAVLATIKPMPARPTITITQPDCTTLRGSLTINNHVDGLQYTINGGPLQNLTSFGNLLPGSYIVIAQNALECSSLPSASQTINQTSCVQITKKVNNETPNVSSNVVFTLEVTNNGPSDATNIVVSDMLPDGYIFIQAPPTYNASTGEWNIGNIPANGKSSIQMTARVSYTGDYTNIATIIAGDTNDPNKTDNTASVTTNPIHPLPKANDDIIETNIGTEVSIDVTKNDTFGANYTPKTGSVVSSPPAHGSVSIDNNGTPLDPTDDKIIYTPSNGYFGDDTFEYTITNYHGDTSTALVTVMVTGFTIPDGFSPNGDAINDTFVIQRSSNLTINLIVFNRWGNKVFEQANYANDWEGTGINNQALPEGTYYRIVEAINNTTGQTQKLSGVITLKR